jgi:hypothetical protein
MRWVIKVLSRLAPVCVVLVGAAGVASLAVGWGQDAASDTDLSPSNVAELSPGEVIASRFAIESESDCAGVSAPSAKTVIARAGEPDALASLIFSPHAIYQSVSAATAVVSAPAAHAAPADTANADTANEVAAATTGVSDRVVTAPRSPERHASQAPARPARRNNALLNDAQIASIKDRLKLTSDQQAYWPQVESALRAITWGHQGDGRKLAANAPRTLDPNAVEGLKSAAIPLIMRLRDDQKSEVRNLARLMGLENVASQL